MGRASELQTAVEQSTRDEEGSSWETSHQRGKVRDFENKKEKNNTMMRIKSRDRITPL